MNFSNNKGFSLVELMLVIGLIGIILAVVLPSYKYMVVNGKKKSEVSHMLSVLSFAKNTALERKKSVVICAGLTIDSSDRIISLCDSSNVWRAKIVSYYEKPENYPPSSEPLKYEQILHNYELNDNYYWVWNSASGGRNYLRFKSNAMTDNQNGTFILCSDKKAIHRIVINKVGRIKDEPSNSADDNKCTI